MTTELFLCMYLLCQLCRLIQSGHTLDCFGIFVQLRKITFPPAQGTCPGAVPRFLHQLDSIQILSVASPALELRKPRNNSFAFTLNTLFVIKQDKDVNGLMLPEHSSCWGAVTLTYCLWIWSSIVGEFMGSFCSLTMQNGAMQGG